MKTLIFLHHLKSYSRNIGTFTIHTKIEILRIRYVFYNLLKKVIIFLIFFSSRWPYFNSWYVSKWTLEFGLILLKMVSRRNRSSVHLNTQEESTKEHLLFLWLPIFNSFYGIVMKIEIVLKGSFKYSITGNKIIMKAI
jgi:hypothetical protein